MQKIYFSKISKIHFIGIGGIGLSAIAKLMLAQGKIVSGSDANKSKITDELKNLGAKIFTPAPEDIIKNQKYEQCAGFNNTAKKNKNHLQARGQAGRKAENLSKDIELVIYTLAIPEDNSELVKAKKLEIPLLTYPEALGKIFNGKFGIAVCGTHGKSTAVSMAGLVLAGAGLDPSVVVGSKVPEFDGNLRIGRGKYFIIEACEYKRAFLEYWPKIIILNNIELDHTDYYKNIEDYKNAFKEFIGHLPEDGVLIMNGDDQNNLKLITNNSKRQKIKIIKFGFNKNNDLRCCKMETGESKTKFWVNYKSNDLGKFILKVPGKFNVYNALAAIAIGLYLGIGANKIKKSLADFGGIWRRFEIKGEYRGATVISDYAHHPTAVKATIEAAHEFYPGKRIAAVFQPHQHNRTKMLYKDFLKSFDSADAVILSEIFNVAGREEKKDRNVSSRKMTEDIKKRNKKLASSVFYAANLFETRKLIDEKIKTGDILIVMGAGDIYRIADAIAQIQNPKTKNQSYNSKIKTKKETR